MLSNDDNADSNCNYNILEDILVSNLIKYIPIKKINFNKYGHKKSEWITTGILKSIKYRDTLYKKMRQMSPDSVEFLDGKHNLKVYNRILKRSIRQAKLLFYGRKFENPRSDSKKTWNIIMRF